MLLSMPGLSTILGASSIIAAGKYYVAWPSFLRSNCAYAASALSIGLAENVVRRVMPPYAVLAT